MFNHVINPTIKQIKTLLNEPKLMTNCKYLCLVGGLSTSKYFQLRMEQQFGPKSKYKLKLIIPRRPILCVVEGAAYFGITNNYIKSRALPHSESIDISKRKAIYYEIRTNKLSETRKEILNALNIMIKQSEYLNNENLQSIKNYIQKARQDQGRTDKKLPPPLLIKSDSIHDIKQNIDNNIVNNNNHKMDHP